MTDERQLDREMDRGGKAAALMRDPLLQEAFDELEASYTQAWLNSDPAKPEVRENQFRMVQALKGVRSHLESVLQTGELAAKELDAIQGKRRFFG